MGLTKNFAEAIRRKLASDSDMAAAVDTERFNVNVGSVIHEARSVARLTQQQLAERVGMHQSAIARLENADYDSHSLKTLERIAFALGRRIEIRFVEQSEEAPKHTEAQSPVEPVTPQTKTARPSSGRTSPRKTKRS